MAWLHSWSPIWSTAADCKYVFTHDRVVTVGIAVADKCVARRKYVCTVGRGVAAVIAVFLEFVFITDLGTSANSASDPVFVFMGIANLRTSRISLFMQRMPLRLHLSSAVLSALRRMSACYDRRASYDCTVALLYARSKHVCGMWRCLYMHPQPKTK